MNKRREHSRLSMHAAPAAHRPLDLPGLRSRLRLHLASSLATLAACGLLGTTVSDAWAAPAGTVLPTGTVPVLRGLVTDYAGKATFSTTATATGNNLTVNQQVDRLILDWNQFNIANGSAVRFNQPVTTSAVLNRIHDQDPSIIQGKLSANGQVYLINQNGILFDRGTQINVNGLITSTLNIQDSTFANGLTAGGQDTPAFSSAYAYDGGPLNGSSGAIIVGANGLATAATPNIATPKGGLILFVAPRIDNQAGLLQAPDGQIILAAGSSAYLYFPQTSATQLGNNGMYVQINADAGDVNLTSLIQNSGDIQSDRGNTTLAALAVNQNGRIRANTAAVKSGSIWLTSSTRDGRSGAITLGANSSTDTPLDQSDTTTLKNDQTYSDVGYVNIIGKSIDVKGEISAPAGQIILNASDATTPGSARVYLEDNSYVSTAGAWALVSDDKNFITFSVTSNELKDSPLQKTGILRGATVTVDARKGSTLLDTSGYVSNIDRTLAEKAGNGGTVTITSSGDVLARSGSTIDVSGGGTEYSAGGKATTVLLGADGKLYDISTASKDLQYVAILNSATVSHSKWGAQATQTFGNTLFAKPEAAYVQGQSAGKVTITSKAGLVLDGQINAGVTMGPLQRASAPAAGTLTLGLYDPSNSDIGIGNINIVSGSTHALDSSFGIDSALPASNVSSTSLSDSLLSSTISSDGTNATQSGFSSVEINANGKISVDSAANIIMPTGGSLTMRAQQLDVAGQISAPSGTVSLASVGTGPTNNTLTTTTQSLVLEAGARIATAGNWTNASTVTTPVDVTAQMDIAGTIHNQVDGGSVSLSSSSLDLVTGGVIDASAGGRIAYPATLTTGAAGSIKLNADPYALGQIGVIHSDLRAYGVLGKSGGSLNITQGSIAIGSTEAVVGTAIGDVAQINADFFSRGGFSKFTLNGINGVTLAGVSVNPQVQSFGLSSANALGIADSVILSDNAPFTAGVIGVRPAASISITSNGALSTGISLGKDASIVTDPGGSVSLATISNLDVQGTISAAAGTIALAVSGSRPDSGTNLHLGSSAQLFAAGTYVSKYNTDGVNGQPLREGDVKSGGSVTISAQNADLALDKGSLIDVSGAVATLDFKGQTGSGVVTSNDITSDAGSLSITAQQNVSLNATLMGQARGDTAGGTFSFQYTPTDGSLTGTRRIVISQNSASGSATAGYLDAWMPADTLMSGGFDKIGLQSQGTIAFSGDVNWNATRAMTLDANTLDVLNGASVKLSSAATVLKSSFASKALGNGSSTYDRTGVQESIATTSGTGTLNVSGDTLDVSGSITVNGASALALTSNHDLRLSGRTVGDASDNTVVGGASNIGGITTMANVTLKATQIYPTTNSTFTIAIEDTTSATPQAALAGGVLSVLGNGSAAAPVLSAGGTLSLLADRIEQGGIVKAPLGTLNFSASQIDLLKGSSTSVSAKDTVVPYGTTLDGVTWYYSTTGKIAAPPTKQISLNAASVNQASGATVDLSGGGQIQAAEFVPGSGGSNDVLYTQNTFAIIPADQFSAMPVDSDIAARATSKNYGTGTKTSDVNLYSDGNIYNTITISSGSSVKAGTYVLLPAAYANLGGATVIQLNTAYRDIAQGQSIALQNGETVVAGVRGVAGTGMSDSRTVGVVVVPESYWKAQSSYTLSDSSFFTTAAAKAGAAAPVVPSDAGHLSISASKQLVLGGTVNTSAADSKSRIAQIDISASEIAIVDQVGRSDIDSSFLQLDANSLTSLNANLLIGGTRSSNSDGTTSVVISANDVLVSNTASSALKEPELLLAANNSISIASGSALSSVTSSSTQVAQTLSVGASGAIMALSGNAPLTLTRAVNAGGNPVTGQISIDASVSMQAQNTMLVDAALNTRSGSDFSVSAGGTLAIGSSQISLGSTDGVTGISDGLVLSNSQLANLNNLGSLTLRSGGALDFYGATTVGSSNLSQLTLDAALLRANGGDVSLQGGSVTLVNSGTDSATLAAQGSNKLSIHASTVNIGKGSKQVSGFASADVTGSSHIVASGSGIFDVAGALNLIAPRIESTSGAVQTWEALDASSGSAVYLPVTYTSGGLTTSAAASSALGSQLTISGKNVSASSSIVLHSGSINLTALGTDSGDGVSLNSGALLDVSGASTNFGGTVANSRGGNINLAASSGAVAISSGARLDVSAAGASAGAISVSGASMQLDGTLAGTAATGQTQGSFSANVGTLGDFSALSALLSAGGFTESLNLRQHLGDITLAAADTLKAHSITLDADAGNINIAGTIDASAVSGGGTVALYAQNDLNLLASSLIDARGTSTGSAAASAYSNGGKVLLQSSTGTLNFNSGSTIKLAAGAKGTPGSVTFVAQRSATNDDVNANLAGTVLSKQAGSTDTASVIVQGLRSYTLTSGTISKVNTFKTTGGTINISQETADFVANANSSRLVGSILGDDGQPVTNTHVQPSVEINAPDGQDLVLKTNFDLTGTNWLYNASGVAQEPGLLTLRSTGNVYIYGALGNQSNAAASTAGNEPNAVPGSNQGANGTDIKAGTPSWAISVVAGADHSAANHNAVQSNLTTTGDVVIDRQNKTSTSTTVMTGGIATGTGDITIAAARDFIIADPNATVTTVGLESSADISTSGYDNQRWLTQGGNISISAGRDAVGVANSGYINDWYRRPVTKANTYGQWWAFRGDFRQGVASFGGGDVAIQAGRDVNNLSAMLPTSGNVVNGVLDVQGGGNLNVSAGRDVIGGEYLVARGSGSISSGGNIGSSSSDLSASGATSSPVQLYLMGISSDAATVGASFDLNAAGNIDIQSVANPTALYLSRSKIIGTNRSMPGFGFNFASQFYTYSDNAAVNVLSESGDVHLGDTLVDDTAGLINKASDSTSLATQVGAQQVLPPSVTVAAPNGSIYTGSLDATKIYDTASIVYPSLSSTVQLLAGKNVTAVNLYVSSSAPGNIYTWSSPYTQPGNGFDPSIMITGLTADKNLVNRADTGYPFVVDALGGDISYSSFLFPAKSLVVAQNSLTETQLTLQNLNASDISVVQAKTGNIAEDSARIQIGGPGTLIVEAGGNVNLASTDNALYAYGSDLNTALSTSASARLVVGAGVESTLDADTLAALYKALIAAQTAADQTSKQKNDASNAAADAFLKTVTVSTNGGDINSYRTAIETTGGSDINLFAPKGNITVGLSSSGSSNSTIGVVTDRGGNINAYLSGDFNVNQGKVLTALGGDIDIYTRDGSIDAGRGARTSRTTSATKRVKTFNSAGVFTGYKYVFSAAATGSGIRTTTSATTDSSGNVVTPKAGSIYLFAPAGTIDAGEAGIASGGNIVLAALQVLNSTNISAAGSSVGVPTVEVGSVSSTLASSGTNVAAGDKAAADAAKAAEAARAATTSDTFKPSILQVEVLGFGPNKCREDDRQCFDK